MTTSRNEETAAASEPEPHATSEAATGETSVRTARAASGEGSGTAGAAEPSAAPEETAGAAPKKPAEASGEASGEVSSTEEKGAAPVPAGAATRSSGAAARPGRKNAQEEETESGGATTATGGATTTATAEGGAATAETEAEAEATATMTATTTADAPEKTGRPNKALLAGAAIAGVLLVTVPFLVHVGGGNDGKRSAGGGEAPGTMLGSGKGDIPGAFASAAPSPRKVDGKQVPGGKDGENTKGGGPSADGAHGSTPLNEGGGSTGGSTAHGDNSARKSGDGTKTTAGKTTTNKTGTGGAAGGSGATTEKSAPQSTVVYTGVAGPGCATPAGGGYQQDGYFSDGSAGWYTRSSGGWSGNGCNGRYVAVPMSGDTGVDAKSRVKWWWKPGTQARTCQISVYIPNSNTSLYVGGHPTKYHVLVNANDRSTMYSSFTINQVAHRGQWVDAGTFALKGSTIGVKLLDRGDDWSKGWEKAHHAAAQIKVTCRS
ncbi:hypothetical protein OHA04_33580 [Streptomyces sp. NBC_01590]|uniref:hypothetical protein n=1 Tax=Streptomyces sp. NBC_01590 TaxID=2975887 RepID=UPI0038637F1A